MMRTVSTFTECHRLKVPSSWNRLAFLSDVHLQQTDPATFQAWEVALAHIDTDALFILGDLFEVWVGDDVLEHPTEGIFWTQCTRALQAIAQRMPVYFIPGNRDFLIGSDFLTRTGLQLLPDPTLLEWPQAHWLLSHGDLLCTDDVLYQAFRQQVRNPKWQHDFLGEPIEIRLNLARQMRSESASRQTTDGVAWTDVNSATVEHWMHLHHAQVLIHGHTHQPAVHAIDSCGSNTGWRVVLSDWDAKASPPRVSWLEVFTPNANAIEPIFQMKMA